MNKTHKSPFLHIEHVVPKTNKVYINETLTLTVQNDIEKMKYAAVLLNPQDNRAAAEEKIYMCLPDTIGDDLLDEVYGEIDKPDTTALVLYDMGKSTSTKTGYIRIRNFYGLSDEDIAKRLRSDGYMVHDNFLLIVFTEAV